MDNKNADKAVRLIRPGGVEQLVAVDWPAEAPGPGEIRLRHEAIGLNFIDIYHRTGLYPLADPAIPGVEGVGIVEALGEGVCDLTVGQSIAYAGLPGAYAATRRLPAWRAVPLPETIPPRTAAASLFRGLTAHMLLTRIHPVLPGDTVLVHAAAGGLGAVLTRWIRHLGGTVIGTAGSEAKAEVARANGADHVVVGREADVVGEVARLTAGRGVDFTVDGIGGTMLARSFLCTRRFGVVASIGQAAGPIPPVAVEEIGPMRSLIFARPSVMAHCAERELYPDAVRAVFAMIEAGIAAGSGPTYALADAAKAQADLEAGRITGSAVLLP
ncbi:quinone oxidoreductase family protein [Consotaella aegiceratis]|uniref:quinone oxidoreductase family protein n=1 Tax=Consotaella aegiceratis TaxID=3097961 RepID=UPI002F3EBE89